MNHDLKISPDDYSRLKDGSKSYHITNEKKGIQKGDTVKLMEFDDKQINNIDSTVPKGFTESPPLNYQVSHVEILGSNTILSLKGIPRKSKK